MRLAKNLFFAIILWLLMPLAVNIPQFLIRGTLFPALCEWFPEVFEYYSPVTQSAEYAALTATLDIIIASLAVFLFSYITVRYDNERMEYMIRRTDGLYSFAEGARLYFPRYIKSDIAVAVAVPTPFVVASALVPEHIHELADPIFDYLFSFGRMYTDHLGYILGGLILSLAILLTRLLSAMKSIKAWQGLWLSEI